MQITDSNIGNIMTLHMISWALWAMLQLLIKDFCVPALPLHLAAQRIKDLCLIHNQKLIYHQSVCVSVYKNIWLETDSLINSDSLSLLTEYIVLLASIFCVRMRGP